MLIAKTDYEVANRFRNIGATTKIGNKKHQVFFKVYCDDLTIDECLDLFRASRNVLMLEYQGNLSTLAIKDLKGVYITKVYDFGNNITEEEIKDVVEELPDGMVGIIRVPQEYSDMHFVYNMSQKYPNIRFCGGTMFCFDGCRIGCCGRDILDKNGIKYDKNQYMFEGCSCAIETVLADDIELEEGKPYKSSDGKGSGSKKSSKSSKKAVKMQDLMYQFGHFEL